MSNENADRNLLFGLLALQNGIITRDALVAAFSVWQLNKGRMLDEILVEQGALSAERQAQLRQMLAWHIEIHGQDAAQSLAAVSSASSACQALLAIGDVDLQASLQQVFKSVSPADPYATEVEANRSVTPSGLRFHTLRPHAKGGLGEVSVALDTELNREVALKEIQPRFADDQQSRERFVLEAEITGGLEHPGIVPVYGLGTYPDGRPFYAMRFIKGDSLKHALEQFHNPENKAKMTSGERQFQLRKLLGRFIDVCNAIEYAHSRGVLHRDLKPGNIMLGKYGESLVVDWGLAKSIGKKDAVSAESTFLPASPLSSSGMTQPGSAIGTPAYMSPEQAAGRLGLIGPVSDVYSLGATLYHILTGVPPIVDQDVGVVLQRVQKGDFRQPGERDPSIPSALNAICLKAMALVPEDRYPNARGLADDIEHWLADEPVTAVTETISDRLNRIARKHQGYVRAGLVGLLLVTVVSVAAALLIDTERRKTNELSDKNAKLAGEKSNLAAQEKSAREKADRNADDATRQTKLAKQYLYLAHMNLAQSAWEASAVAKTVRLLDLYRTQTNPTDRSDDSRGFEWFYWDRLTRHEQLTLKGHSGDVSDVAFSPDGKRLASASSDGTVKVWDAISGQETLTLKSQSFGVARNSVGTYGTGIEHLMDRSKGFSSVAFSPDGKRLASACSDNTVKVWDIASGDETLTLKGRTEGINSVAFSPDGRWLASADRDRTVKVWNAASGQKTLTLKGHSEEVVSVAFSPDGKRLASASHDLTVKVWDVASGQETLTLKVYGEQTTSRRPANVASEQGTLTLNGHSGDVESGQETRTLKVYINPVWSVAFSPDGKRLVSGSDDGGGRVWDAISGHETLTLKGHNSAIRSVAFSPDGKRLVSGSYDGAVKVWDAISGHETLTLKGHTRAIRRVAFSPEGKRLASAGWDGTVKVWDAISGHETLTLKGHTRGIHSVAFSPDGKRLASASYDQTVKIWDAASGQETLTLKGHTGVVKSVAFSPDGKRLASASLDGTVKVWDVASGQETLTLKGQTGVGSSVAFSPDGKRLASAGWDGTVKVWDAISGQETLTLKGHTNSVESVAFSPDGKRLVSGSYDGAVKVWDAISGHETLTLKGHTDEIRRVAFSPDGKWLASASRDKTVKVWDATSGTETLTLVGYNDEVMGVTFSPNGKRLATASCDGTVKVWDATSGTETLTLKGHISSVESVAFSPDGKRLASASWDGTVKVWDARPWTPELRAEREALSLIHFLLDQGKPKPEWLNLIKADQTISESVRQQALQFAREWK